VVGDGRPRLQATIEAVAEVGNPTVVATLTVVAALLPMLFVSGLMGPYMAPIPANASAAMLFSFFVAMVVAPWLMLRLAPKDGAVPVHAAHDEGVLGRIYRRIATPIVRSKRASWIFLIGVGIAKRGMSSFEQPVAVNSTTSAIADRPSRPPRRRDRLDDPSVLELTCRLP